MLGLPSCKFAEVTGRVMAVVSRSNRGPAAGSVRQFSLRLTATEISTKVSCFTVGMRYL